jgi:hypothetical protein
MKTGNWFANVRPADKSLKKIEASLTQLNGKNRSLIPLDDVVANVNLSLRGWADYFHYRNSTKAMSHVRRHAGDRLRMHQMARYRVRRRCAGYVRFPRRDLCVRHGLYKPPTLAGWRSAHPVRESRSFIGERVIAKVLVVGHVVGVVVLIGAGRVAIAIGSS